MQKEIIQISRKSISTSYKTTYERNITQMMLYVQHIGLTYCLPDYKILNRSTPSCLLCVVFNGKGTLVYNKKQYSLLKGTAFILDCSKEQSYFPDPQDPMCLIFVHYDGPTAKEYTNEIITRLQCPLFPQSLSSNLKYRIASLYKEFHHYPNEDTYGVALSLNELLLRTMEALPPLNILHHEIPIQLKTAVSFIEENFITPISVKEISKIVSMSQYHFIREFHKFFGQTPYEYILTCRLKYAKYLLLNSEMTINEIAHLLQFNNTSHFSVFFKTREKCTPLQFRKACKL